MDHPNIIKLFETFEDSWTLRVQDLLVLEERIARDDVSTRRGLKLIFCPFEQGRHIYLVMELCSGGELFDRIIEAARPRTAKAV